MSDDYPLIDATATTSQYNAMQHVIQTAKDAMMTCTIVKVMKLTNGGGAVGPIGRVDVLPLVQMVDGIQKTYSHVTVHNLPYVRIMGGKYAVILDPQVGDIGMVTSADRDISGVKQKQDIAPPGSNRRNNISDGIYIGCALGAKPTSYVRFDKDGNIELTPDGGKTAIWIQPNRIDLGMKNAPHAVSTVDGPSTKVFAVISESGSQD